MSHHFAKPVNALRKANDLVKVDKDDVALRILHNMLLSRRYRTWQSAHEDIMMLYISLAAKNRKNAKDGLLQYRIICQTANVDSLERVILKFCQLAEEKVVEAQRKADAEDAEDAAEADAEGAGEAEEESNEVIDEDLGYRPSVNWYFVAGVGGEDEHDRSKRKLVTPWLKYLWDTYRTVLDVMRNSAKLDELYHATVVKALDYCSAHQRTSEFRRLCEIMRIHMTAINNHQGQTNSVDMADAAVIQAYLRSRFLQLEVASKLDLWQEAYRIIEDIHELLQRSQTALDASLLSTYYSRLEVIFWKSENTLFHAYCVDKLYVFAASSKETSAEALQGLADRLVLAALVIPPRPNASPRLDYLDSEDQKNLRLAKMLGFDGPPSRARLLHQLQCRRVVLNCSVDVQQLFALATSTIAPRTLRAKMSPLLERVRGREGLAAYVPGLLDMVVLALLQQLSRVYRTILLDSFMRMLPDGMAPQHVERVIVRRVRERHARARVDHLANKLVFDENALEAPHVNTLLSQLAKRMYALDDEIRAVVQPGFEEERAKQREHVFQLIRHGMEREHRDVFVRKQVIEKRKQELELAVQRREDEEEAREKAEKLRLAEEERKRLAEERQRRERERLERAEREKKLEANRKMMEKLKEKQGETASSRSRKIIEKLETNLDEMDEEKLLEAQTEVAAEEQRAHERRQREDAKRIDYFTRASRVEERPLLEQAYERQQQEDRSYYDAQWQTHLQKHRERHAFCLKEKERLRRLHKEKDVFVAKIMEKRRAVFNAIKAEQDERVRQREAEKAAEKARYEAEEREKERIRLEELEREQRERERQEEKQREEKQREEKQREETAAREEALRRTAEKQRKREEEIEARKRAEREMKERSDPVAAAAESVDQKTLWRKKVQTAAATTPSSSGASGLWRRGGGGGGAAAASASVSASTAASGTRSWRASGDAGADAASTRRPQQQQQASGRPSPQTDAPSWRGRLQQADASSRKPVRQSEAPSSSSSSSSSWRGPRDAKTDADGFTSGARRASRK